MRNINQTQAQQTRGLIHYKPKHHKSQKLVIEGPGIKIKGSGPELWVVVGLGFILITFFIWMKYKRKKK